MAVRAGVEKKGKLFVRDEQRWIGILEVLASGLCFGFLGFFGKRALASGISPGEFLALRYLLAALMMAAMISLRNRSLKSLYLGAKTSLICFALGVFGYAVFSSFYFMALQTISASLTVILLYLYPVFVTLGGVVFLGEHISRRRIPALPIALSGIFLLVGWEVVAAAGSVKIGVLYGFLSALFYSMYILLSAKLLKNIDPWISTFWIQFGAGLSLFALHFSSIGRVQAVARLAGWNLIGVSFLCSVLAMSLFLSGLLKIRSWEASLLSMSEPIAGVAVGVVFLGERLAASQWLGAAFVLIALIFVSRSSTAKR